MALSAAVAAGSLGAAPAVADTPAVTGPPTSMTALGDSITRGFHAGSFLACFPYLLVDCVQRSWATGTDTGVNSVALRVRRIDARLTTGRTFNDAVTGAKVADLDGQAANALARTVKPELTTVLIGANDVCTPTEAAMTSEADFRRDFDKAIKRLSTGMPEGRIQVSSIPNIYRLWQVIGANSSARSAWNNFNICQSMLANPLSAAPADEERRQRVLAHVQRLNAVIEDVCRDYVHCRYDGGAAFGVAFTLSDMSSIDYFHPGPAGQTKAAAAAWASGFDYADRAAPASTLVTTREADGMDGWFNAPVSIEVGSADTDVKGAEWDYRMEGASGAFSWKRYDDPIVVDDEGTTRVVARSVDVNGNTGAGQALAVKLDRTAPELTVTCPSGPVPQGTAASATVVASDALSGLVEDPTGDVPLDTSVLGTQPNLVEVQDLAGNKTSRTCTYEVVDVTAPTIDLVSPAAGQEIVLGASVPASFSCADEEDGSGLGTCEGTVASGEDLDTSSVGLKTFTVTATDAAGNPATVERAYRVVYAYSGLLQPVNRDGSSVFKLGSTVPLKFEVDDASGVLQRGASATVALEKVTASITGSSVESVVSTSATVGNAFRIGAGDSHYIHNLRTKELSVGTWLVKVVLDDGRVMTQRISLR